MKATFIALLALSLCVWVGCGKKEDPNETGALKAENEKLKAKLENARLKAENARLKADLASNGGTSTPVQTGETKTCYWCKELIKSAAQICKNCGKDPSEPIIKDEIIEKAIRKAAKKPTGKLTRADLERVTELDLRNKQLTDAKGLEKLTQLTRLYLAGNQLTEVPKGLEKLNQLGELLLGDNKLTDVKGLEKLNQLTSLNLTLNQLTDVKGLEQLRKLKSLYLGVNQLTDVKGLENLTQLKLLVLDNNKLTSLKGLEKLTELVGLLIRNNPDLTKAQIDQLQKALPKCDIYSNPTK